MSFRREKVFVAMIFSFMIVSLGKFQPSVRQLPFVVVIVRRLSCRLVSPYVVRRGLVCRGVCDSSLWCPSSMSFIIVSSVVVSFIIMLRALYDIYRLSWKYSYIICRRLVCGSLICDLLLYRLSLDYLSLYYIVFRNLLSKNFDYINYEYLIL